MDQLLAADPPPAWVWWACDWCAPLYRFTLLDQILDVLAALDPLLLHYKGHSSTDAAAELDLIYDWNSFLIPRSVCRYKGALIRANESRECTQYLATRLAH